MNRAFFALPLLLVASLPAVAESPADLIKALESDDAEARGKAVAALAAPGADVTGAGPALKRFLERPGVSMWNYELAARALMATGETELRPVVRRLLILKDKTSQSVLLHDMYEQFPAQVVPYVAALLREDSDKDVRATAAAVLAFRPIKKAINPELNAQVRKVLPAVMAALDDTEPQVR